MSRSQRNATTCWLLRADGSPGESTGPGHLFHPKLWALRYIDDSGEERFRFVCGSRNLTNDRAWDAVISLEEATHLAAARINRPIADLLISLADRVPAGIPPGRRTAIRELADALRFVEWERPENVVADRDWLSFHVMGRGRRTKPNMAGYSRLVVSPFLNDAGFDSVWPEGADDCVVVSRGEELDTVGEPWREWLSDDGALHVLDEGAAIPEPDRTKPAYAGHFRVFTQSSTWSSGIKGPCLRAAPRIRPGPRGVATTSCWLRSSERSAHMGSRRRSAPPAEGPGPVGFGRILLPYTLGDPTTELPEAELRRTLENALRELASLTFTATVEGEHEHPLLWVRSDETLQLPASLPEDVELIVELLTVAGQPHRASFGVRLDHRWQLQEIEQITPFLVMRLASGAGAGRVEVSSVVLARLVGDPTDRLDRVLARRIGTPSEFLRFVLLLLQLAGRESWVPRGLRRTLRCVRNGRG